ncbi:MAG TPA: hypothetical protein VG826_14850 [Pirellulales bacterium]|nr:hypothetical protein [Pirellulales bacterium]
MRMFAWILVLSSGLAMAGCKTQEPVPRGHFFLPEDSFLTLKRVEALVPAGMPIEQAREVMEIHGFVCTYEEAVGVPYLQCNQIKRQHLWPFNGTWMATIYYQEGIVRSVQARYDLNPVERGTKIPKRASREAREIDRAHDAHLMQSGPPATELPEAVEMMPGPVGATPFPPSPPEGVSTPVESSPPAAVPVEIP